MGFRNIAATMLGSGPSESDYEISLVADWVSQSPDNPDSVLHIKRVLDRHPPQTWMFWTDRGVLGIANGENPEQPHDTFLAALFGINLPFVLKHIRDDAYQFYSIVHVGNHEFVDSRWSEGTDWRDLVQSGEWSHFNLVTARPHI